ncbi:MAG: T9SS type A sorting domain-containing protein [Elusimicrobiales bacterium]
MVATDDNSGVKESFYSLDGSTFTVYSSSFPVAEEGRHELGFYSVDNVLNSENIRTAAFGVDLSTPVVAYSLSPLPNSFGWNNGAVDVVFSGTDAVSGIVYCSSSFTVTEEGLNVPVSGHCSDYAGWSSTASFTLSIDTTAPVSSAEVGGAPGQNGWFRSPATLALAVTDNLSGADYLRYSVDGSSYAAYSSSFTVGASGPHEFSYFSADRAGNIEEVKHRTFNIDLEAPAVVAQASPQANTFGWNSSVVNVVFTGTDSVSGLAYCEPQKAIALEGSSQTITGYCTDYAGWSSTASLVLNIDTSSPRISYTAIPAANSLGWNNGEISIKFACADDLSGVMSCPAEIPLAAEGTGISTAAKAVDYAGNFAEAAVSGLKIDRTPPASTIELVGPQRNGWYSGPVTVTLVSTDELSGVKEILYILDDSTPAVYNAPLVVAGDGEHTIRYYTSDNADNLEGYKSTGFRIDAAAPAVGYRQAPLHNAAGWNNTAVEIVFVGTDTMSGIEACSSGTVTLEGQGIPVPGWCRDLAGNVAYATATVNVDMTRPGLAAAAAPQPNAAGWNNGDVRISYACEDGLSGVSYCPSDVTLSGEGADISTRAVAFDHAGNASLVSASAVKIDRTAPVSTVELSGVLRNGWYSGPVEIIIKSTDALAGIKEVHYVLDNKAPAVYSGAVPVPGEGMHALKYYAVDNADNIEEPRTAEFRIDSSSPVVSYTHTPQPNAAGWNNTVVAVAFSGEDGLSGIEVCSSATVAMEGRGVVVPGWCRDLAGNVAYATATLNIDLTPAVMTVNSPLAGQTYIATRGSIVVDFTVKDNLDPAPSAQAWLVQVEDRGSPRGGRPAKIAVAAGQAIEPLDIDDGLWRLEVSATDAAGNTSAVNGGVFEVIHDMLPPRSSLTQAGPAYKPAGTTYLTSAAAFTVNSLDDLVVVPDGIGLGVASQDVKLNAGPVLVKELAFSNARPGQGEVFASTFGFAGLPDGLYSLSYGARDVLANAEPVKDWPFALDNTPPMTQHNVIGVAYETGGKLYMNSTASIGLAGVDVSSGGVASGLVATKLRLDGGMWGIYTTTFSIASAGEHSLEYRSIDNVQNTETLRRVDIVVDNVAPIASVSVGEPQFEVFGLRIITPDTPVTLAAADLGEAVLASGVKAIYYELLDASGGTSGSLAYTAPIKLGAQGTYTLRYWAEDNAGNVGVPKEQRLMVSSLQNDALDAVDGLSISGNADIAGTVKSNAVVSLAGNARILGDVSASTISVSGSAQITGQRFAGVAPLAPAPLYMPAFVQIASATNSNALIPAKYLSGGKLALDAKAELTLSTGVYYFTAVDLKGGSSVVLNGKVDILVEGDISIAGGSSFNAAGQSSRLNLFLSTASAMGFAGGGRLAAYVYAPYSTLNLSGNALLGGHYFVKNAFVSGNGNILQAGESLPSAVPSGGGGGKKVSAMAAQDGTYGVLAGPSTEFRLGEVYVFPNPALRGAAPTFHVEVGIADRVKLTIYTVSGRQAHEAVLTALPVALDDGNGLSYAYEYTWRDSIPSGVYFYHIEAEKGGQKIKKSGKFGVVR